MKEGITIIISMLIGYIVATIARPQIETTEGYMTISCKKVDQIGDTIITINKLIKIEDGTK